jgi:hypothetical protein
VATVAVRYIGPQPERYLPDLGVTVSRGEVFEVSAAFAGSEPSGDDPGAGLLAQVDVWQRVTSSKTKPGPSTETAPRAQEG